ncbi:MAG TPA: hypothetical protein VJ203_07170 [Bacteroidales bacterium]|nr:hypothetical protein [Bacteroidales bacterium]
MKPVSAIFAVLLVLASCQPEENTISGDITGLIVTYAQDYTVHSDQSEVQVSLYKESELLGFTYTDSHGQYVFQDIPYGRYRVDYQKEKFIQTRSLHTVHHIGGSSPTWASFFLFEIPTYQYTLDSIAYDDNNSVLSVFLTITGDTLPTTNNIYFFRFRVFFSNSPDITNDNYNCQGKGYLYEVISENTAGLAATGRIYTYEINNDFELLKAGTIYMRIYPLASGQGYWIEDYFPQALGKPSNVLPFEWDELAGN